MEKYVFLKKEVCKKSKKQNKFKKILDNIEIDFKERRSLKKKTSIYEDSPEFRPCHKRDSVLTKHEENKLKGKKKNSLIGYKSPKFSSPKNSHRNSSSLVPSCFKNKYSCYKPDSEKESKNLEDFSEKNSFLISFQEDDCEKEEQEELDRYRIYGDFNEEEIKNAKSPKNNSIPINIDEISYPLRKIINENRITNTKKYKEYKKDPNYCSITIKDCYCNIF